MAHIAIIVGHPRTGTFCEAIAQKYLEGARASGHDASIFELGRMHFDPILHGAFREVQPLEDDLEAARCAILAADHTVFVFPLWLGGMPALLKGFFERVFQPDLIGPAQQGHFPKLLCHQSSHVIVTMGMPVLVYRLWFHAYEVKLIRRNILGFLGVDRVRVTLFGRVSGVTASTRNRWLLKAERLGRQMR